MRWKFENCCPSTSKALTIALACCSVLALVASSPLLAQGTPMFMALLNAPQATPPILDSNAQGVALVTIDVPTRMLCYSISYSELIGVETVAHFHGPAEPGESAGVLFDISPSPSPLGSPKTGCVGPIDATDLDNLSAGLFYINIHSDVHGGGEIRGQVLPILNVP